VIEKLGGSGMDIVYKAEDIELGRSTALRFLSHNMAQNPRGKVGASLPF
jgi:serine/threonine protein kinase